MFLCVLAQPSPNPFPVRLDSCNLHNPAWRSAVKQECYPGTYQKGYDVQTGFPFQQGEIVFGAKGTSGVYGGKANRSNKTPFVYGTTHVNNWRKNLPYYYMGVVTNEGDAHGDGNLDGFGVNTITHTGWEAIHANDYIYMDIQPRSIINSETGERYSPFVTPPMGMDRVEGDKKLLPSIFSLRTDNAQDLKDHLHLNMKMKADEWLKPTNIQRFAANDFASFLNDMESLIQNDNCSRFRAVRWWAMISILLYVIDHCTWKVLAGEEQSVELGAYKLVAAQACESMAKEVKESMAAITEERDTRYTNVVFPPGSPMGNKQPYPFDTRKGVYAAAKLKTFDATALKAMQELKSHAGWAQNILSVNLQQDLQERCMGRAAKPVICQPGMSLTFTNRC